MEITTKSIIVSGPELSLSVNALAIAQRTVADNPDRSNYVQKEREKLVHPLNLYEAAITARQPFYEDGVQIPIDLAESLVFGLDSLHTFAATSRPNLFQAILKSEVRKERRIWSRKIATVDAMSGFMKKNLPELQVS